jgi:hypothetical protein
LLHAVMIARTLSGAAYDLPWWLRRIEIEADPGVQVSGLAWAAEDLIRSVRRVRAAYQTSGAEWGQTRVE